jgi:hypothetical protein
VRRETCGGGGGAAGDPAAVGGERGGGTGRDEPGVGVNGCGGGVDKAVRGVAAVPRAKVASGVPARDDAIAGELMAAHPSSEAGDPVRAGTEA